MQTIAKSTKTAKVESSLGNSHKNDGWTREF